MLGIRAITLITAFGIALIKTYIIAAEFIHLKVEKRITTLIILSIIIIILIFYFNITPNIMKTSGQHWIKITPQTAAEETVPEHN